MLKDFLRRFTHAGPYNINLAKVETLATLHAQLEYCAIGQGKPLVLVMGYASLMNLWPVTLLAPLAAQYRVIVFNHRDMGGSRSVGQSASPLQQYTEDIAALIQGLSLGKVILAGLSMGGMLAQNFSLHYPYLVEKLILLNTLPPGPPAYMPDSTVVGQLENLPNARVRDMGTLITMALPSLMSALRIPVYCFMPKGTNLTIRRAALWPQQEIIRGWTRLAEPISLLTQMQIPTLVLTGGKDKITPAANWTETLKQLPPCQHIAYAEGTHLMIYQFAEAIAHAITTFIDGTSAVE